MDETRYFAMDRRVIIYLIPLFNEILSDSVVKISYEGKSISSRTFLFNVTTDVVGSNKHKSIKAPESII